MCVNQHFLRNRHTEKAVLTHRSFGKGMCGKTIFLCGKTTFFVCQNIYPIPKHKYKKIKLNKKKQMELQKIQQKRACCQMVKDI